jgi:hypothetical protein
MSTYWPSVRPSSARSSGREGSGIVESILGRSAQFRVIEQLGQSRHHLGDDCTIQPADVPEAYHSEPTGIGWDSRRDTAP